MTQIPYRIGRWLLPSLSQWLWLLLLLVLLAQPWRTMMVASDGDTCMHWRIGETMLQTRQILRADIFSHTRAGQPIISKEWLAEIIFAVAARFGGLYVIAVVAALVIATTFALLHYRLIRDGSDALAATMVVLLAAWASSTHWLARPHVFSFLLVLLWNGSLRRFERNGNSTQLAVMLGALMLVWVNLHGGFLAGLLILGAYWLGALMERDYRKITVLTLVGIVCAAVSLVNPNGYRLHLHDIHFLQSNFLVGWLAEYSSPNFHSADMRGFLAWLALTFLILAFLHPKLRAADGVLLVMWTYFGLYSQRNVPLLVVITAPIIAQPLSDALRERWKTYSERMTQINAASRAWPLVGAMAAVAVIAWPHPTNMPAKNWPVNATEFIRRHPGEFRGSMLNQYMWGGYLMEYLPEHKVFVDGRTDFYGETFIREFSDTTALHTNWTQMLQKYDVGWTLMPNDYRLNLALALLPGWNCAYSDEVATIYRRNPHLPANAPARSYRPPAAMQQLRAGSVAGGQRQAGPDPWSPLAPPAADKPLPSPKGEGKREKSSSLPSFGGEEGSNNRVVTH